MNSAPRHVTRIIHLSMQYAAAFRYRQLNREYDGNPVKEAW